MRASQAASPYAISGVCVFLCFPVIIIKKTLEGIKYILCIISVVYFYFKCVMWYMRFSPNILHFQKTICAILKVFFKGLPNVSII